MSGNLSLEIIWSSRTTSKICLLSTNTFWKYDTTRLTTLFNLSTRNLTINLYKLHTRLIGLKSLTSSTPLLITKTTEAVVRFPLKERNTKKSPDKTHHFFPKCCAVWFCKNSIEKLSGARPLSQTKSAKAVSSLLLTKSPPLSLELTSPLSF